METGSIIAEKLWIGIDWGTHSSKWACYVDQDKSGFLGPICSSTLVRVGEDLVFPDSATIPEGDMTIRGLKRIIILDPVGQDFWEAPRGDTHTSLGEAVSFSFCALLSAVARTLLQKDVLIGQQTDINIGFSLPNWLGAQDDESETASSHFHQAARISCWMFKQHYGTNLPIPGKRFSIAEWKEHVGYARQQCPDDHVSLSIEKMTETVYEIDNVKWSYLVESCAAGLPYLRDIIQDIEEAAPAGRQGLGKLLIIDVGAGSTDVGYMLRTIGTAENLFYFPPAATFEVAGNALTKALRE